jgi:hypothetical protein
VETPAGSTIRNIAAVLPIGTELRRIDLAVRHAEIPCPIVRLAPGSRLGGRVAIYPAIGPAVALCPAIVLAMVASATGRAVGLVGATGRAEGRALAAGRTREERTA